MSVDISCVCGTHRGPKEDEPCRAVFTGPTERTLQLPYSGTEHPTPQRWSLAAASMHAASRSPASENSTHRRRAAWDTTSSRDMLPSAIHTAPFVLSEGDLADLLVQLPPEQQQGLLLRAALRHDDVAASVMIRGGKAKGSMTMLGSSSFDTGRRNDAPGPLTMADMGRSRLGGQPWQSHLTPEQRIFNTPQKGNITGVNTPNSLPPAVSPAMPSGSPSQSYNRTSNRELILEQKLKKLQTELKATRERRDAVDQAAKDAAVDFEKKIETARKEMPPPKRSVLLKAQREASARHADRYGELPAIQVNHADVDKVKELKKLVAALKADQKRQDSLITGEREKRKMTQSMVDELQTKLSEANLRATGAKTQPRMMKTRQEALYPSTGELLKKKKGIQEEAQNRATRTKRSVEREVETIHEQLKELGVLRHKMKGEDKLRSALMDSNSLLDSERARTKQLKIQVKHVEAKMRRFLKIYGEHLPTADKEQLSDLMNGSRFGGYVRKEEGGPEVVEIKRAFAMFDSDQSGSISVAELKALASELGEELTDKGATELASEIDKDGSGEIDFEEFQLWWRVNAGNIKERLAKQIAMEALNEESFTLQRELAAMAAEVQGMSSKPDADVTESSAQTVPTVFFAEAETQTSGSGHEAVMADDLMNLQPVLAVYSAKGLQNRDAFGRSDPLVLVFLDGVEVGRSDVVEDNSDPEWNYRLRLPRKTDGGEGMLLLEVWDHDTAGLGDFLGCASFDKKSLALVIEQGDVVDIALQTSRKAKGHACTGTIKLQMLPPEASTGAVVVGHSAVDELAISEVVEIVGARGITAADGGRFSKGTSDPFCKIYADGVLLGQTSVQHKTLDPMFAHSEKLPGVHAGQAEQWLRVEVFDHDVGNADDFLGMVEIRVGLLYDEERSFPLQPREGDDENKDKVMGTLVLRRIGGQAPVATSNPKALSVPRSTGGAHSDISTEDDRSSIATMPEWERAPAKAEAEQRLALIEGDRRQQSVIAESPQREDADEAGGRSAGGAGEAAMLENVASSYNDPQQEETQEELAERTQREYEEKLLADKRINETKGEGVDRNLEDMAARMAATKVGKKWGNKASAKAQIVRAEEKQANKSWLRKKAGATKKSYTSHTKKGKRDIAAQEASGGKFTAMTRQRFDD